MKGVGKTVDIAFLFQSNPNWTRLIGFEEVDAVHPRLFFNSELVNMLECDAFECGYSEDVSWWYIYYENGEVVDRFESDPLETIVQPHYDQPLDPYDARTMYYESKGIRDWQYASLPSEILSLYQGDPAKLEPIMIEGNSRELESLITKSSLEEAIQRLSKIVDLSLIGQHLSIDVFSALGNRLVPPDEKILDLINIGLNLLIFQNPDVNLQVED